MALDAVLEQVDAGLDQSLERLFDLLRIKSISTDPAYRADCLAAAEFLVAELSALGFDASVRPTPGHPMVVAHAPAAAGPHVLFYGHYDVQPVDPLDLWDADPFDPKIMTMPDGSRRITGRGSADDKGQLMTFVEACRAYKTVSGRLPCSVTIFFEGEEESGSPSLHDFLEANRADLKADIALVCDTNMWNRTTPAITTTLRGLLGEEITLQAADMDLHSGYFGGAARNPIEVLAKILASLKDDAGRITVPGFYEGVSEIPADIRKIWDGLDFDPKAFLGGVGLSEPAGEKDRSVLEQTWTRPTFEINGIWGGYTGAGFKTVIPAKAHAKVSFRLVGTQDPLKIRESFRALVRSMLPPDCSVEFTAHGASAGTMLPFDSPWLTRARGALDAEWGVPTAMSGIGGSIPVVGDFKTYLGMDSLMVGFGLGDDRIHSPNEKYELSSFHRGIRSWVRILGALAQQ
ncbi:MAG: M20/M25/M40 family metallo-hydrolase [Rhizobiales bacterium]|nr:M20/M25/M40 family metallo-hydrolase [Hyphomicrobiales bacterium]